MKNKTIGIYLITERETRRDVYVGQGIVYDRWKKHRSKYPEELFDYRILLECPRSDLNFWEQHYIRVLKTHWSEGGHNQNWGGQFWPRPEEPTSPETRKKQSEALRVRYASMTKEEKQKRSQKISEAVKAQYASMTPEKKREWSKKSSEAFKAYHASMTKEEKKEYSQKRSETRKAREASLSEEEKQKRSEACKAREASMSEEEKRQKSQKCSEAAKAQRARERAAKAAAIAALEALLAS